MKLFNSADTSVLKHHYEKKLLELEQEKKVLQVIDLCNSILVVLHLKSYCNNSIPFLYY